MQPISKINTILTREYVQKQPENQYLERKGLGKDEIKPSKIADELIGMLNADGGTLVFGISDSGEIQDLTTLDDLDKYRKLVFDFIVPPCNIELEEIEIDGKLIFIFHVEQELERIFKRQDNEKIFLRVADTNRELNREQVRKLEYDKMIRRFEDEIIEDFDRDDLDNELLRSYQEKLNYQGDILDLLYKRHLVVKKDNQYFFKKSAILLFSKEPDKYIPSATIRYIRYDGIESKVGEEHNVIKDERFEKNIPKLIEEIRYFLKASLRDYYFLNMKEGKFLKVPEYPEAAWLEGIVNALCHRSYNIQGNPIQIKHFDNRIEISNSGPLPAQVTVENIKTERFARNPRIARVLEDLGYVRQLNEGVSRIYEVMEQSMLAKPEYKEQNKNVYLTLRNRISNHTKAIHTDLMTRIEDNWLNYNSTQQEILMALFLNGEVTIGELSERTKIHHNTIRSYLTKFVEEKIIERHSKKQRDINAIYTLKKD